MRIVCPSCQAVYEVPETVLGTAPRRLRCARCANEWTPPELAGRPAATQQPPAAPVAPAGTAPDPQPVVRPAAAPFPDMRPLAQGRTTDGRPPPLVTTTRLAPEEPETALPPPRRRRGMAVVAWVLSLAVLAGAVWAAYAYRAEIMAAWPPSQRAYAAMGLV